MSRLINNHSRGQRDRKKKDLLRIGRQKFFVSEKHAGSEDKASRYCEKQTKHPSQGYINASTLRIIRASPTEIEQNMSIRSSFNNYCVYCTGI